MSSSMMEQLPEKLTKQVMRYLDLQSVCSLSNTCRATREAAKDDDIWRAFYRNDFRLELPNLMPKNGWKSYYALTRAVVNANAEFFEIVEEKSLPRMIQVWLNAEYVKCMHGDGPCFSGYNAVIGSWAAAFDLDGGNLLVRDVCARVLTDEIAWVTAKIYFLNDNMIFGPYNMTTVFELHDWRWLVVHHHGSISEGNAEEAGQHV